MFPNHCQSMQKNMVALGEFYQRTAVLRSRTPSRTRDSSDVFERDPFKIQSYNFRYAERPQHTTAVQYKPSALQSLRQAQATSCRQRNGMPNARTSENVDQPTQLGDCLRCKGIKPEEQHCTGSLPPSTACSYAGAMSQQRSNFNETSAYAYLQLPGNVLYAGQIRETTDCAKRSAALSSPCRYRDISSCAARAQSSTAIRRNEGPITVHVQTMAPAKLYARETSKAVAAAVGTVGCPNYKTAYSSSAKSNGRYCPKAVSKILDSRGKSAADTEFGGFATQSSCTSAGVVVVKGQGCKVSNQNNNEFRPGSLQKPSLWNVVANGGRYRSQSPKNDVKNIFITIKDGPQKSSASNESLFIKIDSATPIRITRSVSTSTCTLNTRRESGKGKESHAARNFNGLNNLTKRNSRTNMNATRGLNITKKFSVDAINRDLLESKCSLLNDDNNSYHRAYACDEFFEREDNRLGRRKEKQSATCSNSAREAENNDHLNTDSKSSATTFILHRPNSFQSQRSVSQIFTRNDDRRQPNANTIKTHTNLTSKASTLSSKQTNGYGYVLGYS